MRFAKDVSKQRRAIGRRLDEYKQCALYVPEPEWRPDERPALAAVTAESSEM